LAILLALASFRCAGQAADGAQSERKTALMLEQQGRNAEAEAAWKQYLQDRPSSPEPYAHLGLLAARREHYAEAIPLYRKALALNPSFPSIRLNLGLALFKSGELKQAIVEFKPLLDKQQAESAERQRLTILIGMAHYGLAEYAQAVPYLKQAATYDKQNLPLRLALAHSYLWSRQYQGVLDTYKEILALGAESAEADLLAGEALDEKKDHFRAAQMFRAAVKADPKTPGAHFALGYQLWTQKQFPEAAKEFQAELAIDSDHAQALAYLADIDLQTQQPEAALPLLEKAIRINPDIEQAHLDLGILYADGGRSADALRELKEAEKMAPGDVNVHWRLGRLYRTMGKNDEAKAEFEQASRLTKKSDDDLLNDIDHRREKTPQAPPPEAPATEK
jgi:tetratricopeptide (TPR) repeat protein